MSVHNELPVLLLIVSPLLAALVSLTGRFLPSGSSVLPAFLVWLGGSLAALWMSLPEIMAGGALRYSVGGWAEPLGICLEVGGVTWVAALTDVVVASAAWLCTRRHRIFGPLFYFFFFMALFSLQSILCTRDVFNLFVWFEVLSISSFVLISHDRSALSRLAAIRYLLISSVSILFFLVGVWVLYRLFGVLSLESISSCLAESDPELGSGQTRRAVNVAMVLIAAGILTRAAVIPFHTWLPDAHTAAPYPVSALLSGFAIKAPVIALWRIFDHIPFPPFLDSLVWLGAVCALWGVLAAMAQTDAKRLLGYSSISQIGYIVAAFGAGGGIGRSAALFYIVAHAQFKSLLFLTVGYVTSREGTRDLYALRGLRCVFPVEAALFFVAGASMAGLPLFAGYAGKVLVAASLHEHPAQALLLLTGIGTAASIFKLSRIFLGRPGAQRATAPPQSPDDEAVGSASICAYVGMGIVTAGCLLLGVFASPVYRLLQLLTGETAAFHGGSQIQWFATGNLLQAFAGLAAGFVVSLFLSTNWGRGCCAWSRQRSLGLDGSLRLLTAGFLLLLLYVYGVSGAIHPAR